MRRVIVESPYAGNISLNLRYLRACLRDCLKRSEAPFASHAIYTQPGVLNDHDSEERKLGIEAGFAWWAMADAVIFYIDLGESREMKAAGERVASLIKDYHSASARILSVEERHLPSEVVQAIRDVEEPCDGGDCGAHPHHMLCASCQQAAEARAKLIQLGYG